MRHILSVLVVLLPLLSPAATISSTTCASPSTTGCVTLSFTNYPSTISAVGTQVTGTWVGTIEFQGSVDGVNYTPLRGYPVGGGAYASSTSANGAWTVLTAGMLYYRARATAWTSGSATVSLHVTSSPFMPDVIRAVGATFGEVQVSGTVDLSSATLASMGNYICAAAESHRLNLTTTPTIIPSEGPIAGRTSWTLVNVDSVKKVSCRVDPGDGGVPDCNTPGFGLTVQPNGGTLTFPVRESDTVRCVACTNGATVEHTEEACVAP
jgi:hypothetical protein